MKIRLRPAADVTTALLVAALTACSSTSSTSDEARDHSGGLTVSHVHGLGIDPSDGRLYVATHEGVVAVANNREVRRVGDKADYMGFTVIREKTFLGSGHPAEGTGDDADRGLIQSTDAGKTWKTLSLGGTADFHALKYAHNTIYGYDSTRGVLRVSTNRTTWDTRAQLAALDFAVNPKDPDLLLATTEVGIAKSTDGGRTFGAGNGDVLAYLSWPKPDALFGVDLAGGLHRSTDSGAAWKKTGTVPGGRPQALTALDATHILTATQDGIYESRDGGKTFARRLPISDTEER